MRRSLQEKAQRQVQANGSPTQQWVGPVVLTVAVGLAYFLTARLSLLLKTQPGVAVFWPAAGVAAGTLIAFGRTTRWPVAIGVIVANMAASLKGGGNLLSSSIFSLSNAGEPLLVAWFVERSVGSNFNLGRLRHMLGLLVAALVATASGLGGVLGFKLGYNPADPTWTVWRQWLASDAIGIIGVAPLIIGLVAAVRVPPSQRELIEGAVALIVVAAATGLITFMLPATWWEMCLGVVLLLPAVLWVAARCQPVFSSAAVCIVSFIVMATVTFKLGNYGFAAPSTDDSIMSAQFTIAGTGFCAFILSALFAERRQHEAVAAQSEDRLQEALAAGAVLAFDWDTPTDWVRRSNNAAQILGYDPQQPFDGKSFLARVHPDDLTRMKALWSTLNRDNSTCSIIYRFLRLDGREVWLQETSKAEFDGAGRLCAPQWPRPRHHRAQARGRAPKTLNGRKCCASPSATVAAKRTQRLRGVWD
jgi:integral membrane sensor domain MASE1